MYVNIFAYSLDKRIIFLFLEKYSSKLPARQCLETLSLLHAHTYIEKQMSSLPGKHRVTQTFPVLGSLPGEGCCSALWTCGLALQRGHILWEFLPQSVFFSFLWFGLSILLDKVSTTGPHPQSSSGSCWFWNGPTDRQISWFLRGNPLTHSLKSKLKQALLPAPRIAAGGAHVGLESLGVTWTVFCIWRRAILW